MSTEWKGPTLSTVQINKDLAALVHDCFILMLVHQIYSECITVRSRAYGVSDSLNYVGFPYIRMY